MKRNARTAGLGSYQRKQKTRRVNDLPYNQRLEARSAMARVNQRNEFKVTDVQLGPVGIAAGGAMSNMVVNLVRGTSILNNFVGQKVQPVGMQLRYAWTMGPLLGAGDGTNICRTIVFQWLDTGVPAVGVILQNLSPLSPINIDNRQNINVLHDNLTSLCQQGGAALAYDAKAFKVYIKGKKFVTIDYQNAAANLTKGGIFMLNISDSAVVPAPNILIYSRITYND